MCQHHTEHITSPYLSFIKIVRCRYYYYPHLIDKETEVQQSYAPCSGLSSKKVPKLGFHSRAHFFFLSNKISWYKDFYSSFIIF